MSENPNSSEKLVGNQTTGIFEELTSLRSARRPVRDLIEDAKELVKTRKGELSEQAYTQLTSIFQHAEDQLDTPPADREFSVEDDYTTDLDILDVAFKKAMSVSSKPGGTRAYRKKFDKCVKAVRRTVKARKGSNKESAAIAICTKSVLHTRGRTMKKYKKGKLITQKF